MDANEGYAALAKAQGAMKAATFNRINPHFKNRYADLAAVLEAIREPLASNGLSITQTIEMREHGMVLVTTMRHASGFTIDSSEYPLPNTARPQELGSALTYARRYSLCAIACIAADEDDDAEGARQQDQHASAARRKPAAPATNVMIETSAVLPAEQPAPPPPLPHPPTVESGAGDPSEIIFEWDERLSKAAGDGMDELKSVWATVPAEHQKTLKAALDRRHKPRATQVDAMGRS